MSRATLRTRVEAILGRRVTEDELTFYEEDFMDSMDHKQERQAFLARFSKEMGQEMEQTFNRIKLARHYATKKRRKQGADERSPRGR